MVGACASRSLPSLLVDQQMEVGTDSLHAVERQNQGGALQVSGTVASFLGWLAHFGRGDPTDHYTEVTGWTRTSYLFPTFRLSGASLAALATTSTAPLYLTA